MKLAIIGNNAAKVGGVNREWTTHEIERVLLALEPDAVYVGMSRGADLWAAEVCAALGIPFHAVLPHPHQSAKWTPADREFHTRMVKQATTTTWVSEGPRPMALLDKNTAIVEVADQGLVIWDGVEDGGTFHAVNLLVRSGKPWVWINPVTRRTTRRTARTTKESSHDRSAA